MENSFCEKPERQAPRRLSDHLMLEGQKQKVHSLVDKVYSRENLRLAWERVRANQGASGADRVTIEVFEAGLEENLARLHRELREQTYQPQAVRRLEIPKRGAPGKTRPLGIPSVYDRVCQQALVNRLEPIFEKVFDPSSFGYRKGRKPADALGKIWREMGAGSEWIVDADLKDYFDSIETHLLMRAVRCHTKCAWVLLYIERWLKAPVQMPDGSVVVRERGTPQGGVISPLLANLFLHYAFDAWMRRNYPDIPFERYADDAICHCNSEEQATALRQALESRFCECGLTLHPEKTKIVYCRDDDRRQAYPSHRFDFLGYTFRPRLSRRRGDRIGVTFSPAVADKALKAIRQTVRRWVLHERSDKSLEDLARMFNPHIRGWINYYGRYYKSALYPTLRHIDSILARWAHRKFKSLRRHRRRSRQWLERIARRQPSLFAHWGLLQGRGWIVGAV
jgi:RNA-directed DNA polymerase